MELSVARIKTIPVVYRLIYFFYISSVFRFLSIVLLLYFVKYRSEILVQVLNFRISFNCLQDRVKEMKKFQNNLRTE